ncbi:MAG: primosomal protein N' [Paludibacteraceae bacterium]|nr:primosomal protein N' [Paludibacteraceae bacterium]
MMNQSLYDIILPLAIADVYTYNIPEALLPIANRQSPITGCRVLVPLGKKSIIGIIYRQHEGELPASVKVRDVLQIVDETPIITTEQLKLWEWLSSYYMCTLGEVMAAALPSEIIDDNYSAATTQYIQLSPAYLAKEAQQQLIGELKRAKKQEQLVRDFLRLAQNYQLERRLLLEQTGVSGAILRILIDKGVFLEEQRPMSRLQQYTGETQAPHTLDQQQSKALAAIQQAWEKTPVTLLHGVTSSGKTEVYIHLIDQVLKQGKQVLYLVPEIALTTQLTDRLRAVFGEQLVVYHSRFSNAERVEIYNQVQYSSTMVQHSSKLSSEKKTILNNFEREALNYAEQVDTPKTRGRLILGARSAIFLPFSDLGLIIVDEEHEPSYKQQDPAPRYHARSAAIMMAHWYGAKVLLGTATPSIESYHNALSGKYGLVKMKERFQGLQLPQITMIDLQRQYHRKEMYGHFADPLVDRIREELAKGKQVILFQNRRGYAPVLQCAKCGEAPKCPNCDVTMTYHKATNALVCHYCGHSTRIPSQCPKCGGEMRTQGFGTERLEEEIKGLFPEARVARMDLDSTRKKDSYQQIIDDFAAHRVDILIGTQMVTKGLHFNDVSLVAVLQADSLLNMPDFRSYEQAFQMLEQVSGRAGRTGSQGEVMIQTFNLKNPVFEYLKAHDYEGLYKQQIAERELFKYPPYQRVIMLTLRHRDLGRLDAAATLLQQRLQQSFGKRVSGVIIPSVTKISNQWVRQIRMRIESTANIARAKALLKEHIIFVQQQEKCKGTIILPDVDPM